MNIDTMTFWELIRLHAQVGWEIFTRSWWVWVIWLVLMLFALSIVAIGRHQPECNTCKGLNFSQLLGLYGGICPQCGRDE
jgi:hypothetical protein